MIREQDLTPDRDDGANQFSDTVPEGKVVGTEPQPGTELETGTRVVIILSKGPEPKPVPDDLRNKTRDEAFEQLEGKGFTPKEGTAEFDPEIEGGRVVRTDPEAGTVLDEDRTVTVILSNAITVPDVRGDSADDARRELEGLGLDVDFQSFGGGDDGRVFEQSIAPDSRVEQGRGYVVPVRLTCTNE